MNGMVVRTVAACLMVVGWAGCNKDSDSPKPAGGGGGTAAVATPASEGDVVGVWKAAKVETAGGGELPGALQRGFMSTRIEVRPDHTFRSNNEMMGRTHGTWKLDGSTLALTPVSGAAAGKATAWTFERPRLANREEKSFSVILERQGPVPADAGPKYRLTAEEFRAEIKRDEAAAKAKYNDVSVELSGAVDRIDDHSGDAYVSVGGVQCVPLEAEPWAMLGLSQRVKVVGAAAIGYGTGALWDATIALDGPPVLIDVTAEALAGEYAKDAKGTLKKYERGSYSGKSLRVTGTVLEKQVGGDGKPSVLVLGKGDARVECSFGNDSEVAKAVGAVQVGQTVRVAGTFSIPFGEEKGAKVVECRMITK